MQDGGCHCGAIRYRVSGEMHHHALCHCNDCRRCAGATPVAWIAFGEADVVVLQGEPRVYHSSAGVERHFCGDCGTGLFYTNPAILPGIIDVQSSTLDNAAEFSPQAHIMMADALPWEASVADLPRFDQYPGEE